MRGPLRAERLLCFFNFFVGETPPVFLRDRHDEASLPNAFHRQGHRFDLDPAVPTPDSEGNAGLKLSFLPDLFRNHKPT